MSPQGNGGLTVVAGAGRTAVRAARHLGDDDVVGLVGSRLERLPGEENGLRLLGPPEKLPAIVDELGPRRVVVAFSNESADEARELVARLLEVEVPVEVAAGRCERPLALGRVRACPPSRRLKRALDLGVGCPALAAALPLLLLIALAVKLDSPGPVFFRQERVGAGGRRFRVFKFRTMVVGADEQRADLEHLNVHLGGGDPRLFKIPGDPRTTRVGRLLRRFFLDELPQLINVVRGEMSLVGPRPLVVEEDRHVEEWAARRRAERPGMTGLWQVLGHSTIPFDEMVKLDYLYVSTWSLGRDLRLLARTVPLVLRGGGGNF